MRRVLTLAAAPPVRRPCGRGRKGGGPAIRRGVVSAVLVALAAVAWLGAGASPARAQSRPFTPDLLVDLDRASGPRLSPDGRRLAYVVRRATAAGATTAIYLADLSRPEAPHRRLAEAAGEPVWSRDGAFVYFLGREGGAPQVWRAAATGDAAQPVTRLPVDVGGFRLSRDGQSLVLFADVFPDCADLACTRGRLDAQKGRPGNIVYRDMGVRFYDAWEDGLRQGLFAVRIGDRPATDALALTRGWMADVPARPGGGPSAFDIAPDGRSVVFTSREPGVSASASAAQRLYRVPIDGSAPPTPLNPRATGADSTPAFSPDGRRMAFLHQDKALSDGGRAGIVVRDASGVERRLGEDLDRSPQDIAWAPDGRAVFAIVEDGGQQRLYRFGLASGRAEPLTGDGTVTDFDVAQDGLVYLHDSFAAPSQVFHTKGAGAARQVTQVGEAQLAGVAMAKPESFTFAGWNGETVQGFVVPPTHVAPGQRYPVVFVIHGGPHGAYDNAWSYLRNPQVWASRGYATVFINFHGSTGFGEAFAASVQGHWGDRPLEDLQKGWAAALARYPYLDGGRACALGSSYGGYMVDWIAGVWSEPWRCLVSHAGVFDTRAAGLSGDLVWYKDVQMGGSPILHTEAYERFNPRNHVSRWTKPILLTHGGRDLRVTANESVSAFIAAQRLGVPSEFLYLPDANHLVTRRQDTLDWYAAVNGWLDRWTR